jgi:hypothetical protein
MNVPDELQALADSLRPRVVSTEERVTGEHASSQGSEQGESPVKPDEVPDDLVDLFIATTHPGKGTIEARRVALAAFAARHGQAVLEAERAAIIKGIKEFFASVDDTLYDDLITLCGRIERGEYSARGES